MVLLKYVPNRIDCTKPQNTLTKNKKMMITEAIATYYTRVAERWMVSRDVNNHSRELPSGNSVQSITLQNPFERKTDFSRFVAPKKTETESGFGN
jgi:hypothetical protein